MLTALLDFIALVQSNSCRAEHTVLTQTISRVLVMQYIRCCWPWESRTWAAPFSFSPLSVKAEGSGNISYRCQSVDKSWKFTRAQRLWIIYWPHQSLIAFLRHKFHAMMLPDPSAFRSRGWNSRLGNIPRDLLVTARSGYSVLEITDWKSRLTVSEAVAAKWSIK